MLAEAGWTGLTARAVAQRAGAQLGLIHYHFGSFTALKLAVTASIIDDAFGPALRVLNDAATWQDGIADVIAQTADQRDRSSASIPTAEADAERLAGAALAASMQEDAVRVQMSDALVAARVQVESRLRRDGIADDLVPGHATLIVAVLDGLLLHRLIDPYLNLDTAAEAARALLIADPASSGAVPRRQ